ncbi:MAG TPA: GNAT family N-acetyltransferase [Pyrinomonadaceae bacterium]|nr:GNAT family N-acetyltransferase [Pyrinomonadaceae bacterium]
MNVRFAKPAADAAQIVEIYNYYIETSHATFETETLDSGEMEKRIRAIGENYPYLVAEEETGGEILGYAYATKYKERAAYRHSTEVSVYVKNDLKQRGIGSLLYQKLFAALARKPGIHAVIAGISLPNEASVRLHEKFGFEKVAHFREVGFKFGRWIDVGYWEMIKNDYPRKNTKETRKRVSRE